MQGGLAGEPEDPLAIVLQNELSDVEESDDDGTAVGQESVAEADDMSDYE